MKRRSFTNAQRSRIVDKIDALRKEGKDSQEAAKTVGIAQAQYYTWRRRLAATAFRGNRKPAINRLLNNGLDIPATLQIGNTVVIKGTLKFVAEE